MVMQKPDDLTVVPDKMTRRSNGYQPVTMTGEIPLPQAYKLGGKTGGIAVNRYPVGFNLVPAVFKRLHQPVNYQGCATKDKRRNTGRYDHLHRSYLELVIWNTTRSQIRSISVSRSCVCVGSDIPVAASLSATG